MGAWRYVVVDVFTDTPLCGNQLAVFTDARDISPELMQALARELKLAESVFVLPATAPGADVAIRIFTPAGELPFAGHPVLGAAFVLAAPLQKTLISLQTKGGIIPVSLERDGARIDFGWMQQPVPAWEPFAAAAELLSALGLASSLLPVEVYDIGPRHIFVACESAEVVGALSPDLRALAALTAAAANCFAPEDDHWKTRMFAPAYGVPEDAATGSAAGPLALHLCRHQRIDFGQQIEIVQGAEIDRPSRLYARAEGSAERVERLMVGGRAVTVARGEFRLP